MSNKGWKPGFTTGTSEGRWTPVNDDKRMRYEKANPQHYETPDTDEYRAGWERVFGKRAARMNVPLEALAEGVEPNDRTFVVTDQVPWDPSTASPSAKALLTIQGEGGLTAEDRAFITLQLKKAGLIPEAKKCRGCGQTPCSDTSPGEQDPDHGL